MANTTKSTRANRAKTAAAKAGTVTAPAPKPLSTLVRESIKEDHNIRTVLTEQLAKRAKESKPFVEGFETQFRNFRPSKFTAIEREPGTFLRNHKDLHAAVEAAATKGAASLLAGTDSRAITLRAKGELDGLLDKTAAAGNVLGTITAMNLFNFLIPKLITPPTLRNDPAVNVCKVNDAVEKALRKIEGTEPEGNGLESDEPEAAAVTGKEPAKPKDFVSKHVHDLMRTTTSPEERLLVNIEKRATPEDAALGAFKFQLRDGASDVTSYHDFNSLQIAFEHVWEEILDNRLGEVARQLYFHYNQVLSDYGLDDDERGPVTSITDLQKLTSDIRTFLGTTASPPSKQASFDLSNVFAGLFGFGSGTTRRPEINTPQEMPNVIEGATRLSNLLEQIDKMLKGEYSFTVFAAKSVNFGIMVTYRQTWRPESYQVGDLVSTIPLAPRETRRYTTRRVTKKSRAAKELEDNLRSTKSEADSTSRAEREIVAKAENKTNFNITAQESYGEEAFKLASTQQAGGDQAQLSADTKKNFREAVLKSAQEYRQQNRMEVETSASEETEDTTFHEIQNPNDELTVTYLLYELQRTYRISEKIHRVVPVVLVANEVPTPAMIDDAWLLRYDWILRRVILDDSFRAALDYLTKSFTGAELNLQLLQNNAKAQKQVVDEVKALLKTQNAAVETSLRDLSQKADAQAGLEFTEGILGTVKKVFDPFGLTGNQVTGTGEGAQALVDFAQTNVDRAEREKSRLMDQLGVATTALQTAVDKLSVAMREHYDRLTEIDRLRIHVKENILYYMQAIWTHEPPDQRFFRIFNLPVPILEPATAGVNASATKNLNELEDLLNEIKTLKMGMPRVASTIGWKPLVEVADLDQVLGYKGNYAIYRLKENNYLTLHMMQNYLEVADDLRLRDPDEFANYTVDQLRELADCLYRRDKPAYNRHRVEIKKLIVERLMSGRAEDDRVVVPTSSLYIEALVGTHPLLEDFKLSHRLLDVKKVQADVRHAELENIRLSARALEGERGDPDIDKRIVIDGVTTTVAVTPDD